VGFNGDGDGRLRISEEELLRYLTAAPILTQLKPQIVRSAILSKIELSEDSKPGERVAVGRALDKELDSVEFELSFHVSHPAGLMSRIEKAVELALRDSSVSESEPSPAKVWFSLQKVVLTFLFTSCFSEDLYPRIYCRCNLEGGLQRQSAFVHHVI